MDTFAPCYQSLVRVNDGASLFVVFFLRLNLAVVHYDYQRFRIRTLACPNDLFGLPLAVKLSGIGKATSAS